MTDRITMDGAYVYQEPDHGAVRVLCIDAPGAYPVRTMDKYGAMWMHTVAGRSNFNAGLDLIPAPVRYDGFVVIYIDLSGKRFVYGRVHDDEASARADEDKLPHLRRYIVPVSYDEGDGKRDE